MKSQKMEKKRNLTRTCCPPFKLNFPFKRPSHYYNTWYKKTTERRKTWMKIIEIHRNFSLSPSLPVVSHNYIKQLMNELDQKKYTEDWGRNWYKVESQCRLEKIEIHSPSMSVVVVFLIFSLPSIMMMVFQMCHLSGSFDGQTAKTTE